MDTVMEYLFKNCQKYKRSKFEKHNTKTKK